MLVATIEHSLVSHAMIEYFRAHILPLKPVQLLVQTGFKWQRDNCSGMSAALAYYALFSLFPILLVILSVLGAFLGPETNTAQQVQAMGQRFLPPEVHGLIANSVQGLNQSSVGAGLIGFSLLIYSASTVFSVLNTSVDQIWQDDSSTQPAESLRQSIIAYLLNKLLAFILVFGVALLLLASMVSNLVIKALLQFVYTFEDVLPNLNLEDWNLAQGLQTGSSFFMLAAANLVLLKILPSQPVSWRDLWPGALLSSALLVGLQQIVSTSIISIGSRYLSYGVIGGVMILLLWIYFIFQIFLIGCEFSYVFSYLLGSRRHQRQ
jgi:membrane protein